jgi:multidrug efflux pump subunit AcrA (membrane-fusion protein)
LPESLADLQTIADQIELDKLAAAGRITNLSQKISEKQTELTTKNGEFTSKDTELTTLIQKIITKKREELNKSNIKEFDNQTASGGADNRKTRHELYNLETALCEIRYLENDGGASLDSWIADENTALTTIQDILSKTLNY